MSTDSASGLEDIAGSWACGSFEVAGTLQLDNLGHFIRGQAEPAQPAGCSGERIFFRASDMGSLEQSRARIGAAVAKGMALRALGTVGFGYGRK